MTSQALRIPGVEDPSALACIARARNFPLYCKMVEDAQKGICPFCKLDPQFNAVIGEDEFWNAWQSKAPEKHTRHHFIIAPKRHVTDTDDLSDREWLAFRRIMTDLRERHGYTSRGLLLRDGDARLSAGTIAHLHAHIMVPDGTGRVESPFYKGAEADAESLARAIVFEKLRQGTPITSLAPDEQALVRNRM